MRLRADEFDESNAIVETFKTSRGETNTTHFSQTPLADVRACLRRKRIRDDGAA